MEQTSFQALVIAVPTISVLVGILVNNRQLESVKNELKAEMRAVENKVDGLRNEMNARFESQTQGLLRVEQVMDARISHLEKRAER